jgi:hypothetical protein
LIGPADTRRIASKDFVTEMSWKCSPRKTALPSFFPTEPEDSPFLPRYGHAMRAHFALGPVKGGDCEMMIKASGRSALILATGLFVCFAGPSQAAADADDAALSSESAPGAPIALNRYAQHGSRDWKNHAHRRSHQVALKSSAIKKAADVAAADADSSTAIPAWLVNANAQMTPTDRPASNGGAMVARATDILQAAGDKPTDSPPAAETQIVSADQLNDVDRALQESKPIAVTTGMTSAGKAVTAAGGENSIWDQTSQIGKIFIGFGVLLTMASAARMFMV